VLGLLLLFPIVSHAQVKTIISGTIRDANGESLIGATVIERDKDNRTLASAVTDIDGNFSISVSNTNNNLVFRYIGFRKSYCSRAQRVYLLYSKMLINTGRSGDYCQSTEQPRGIEY